MTRHDAPNKKQFEPSCALKYRLALLPCWGKGLFKVTPLAFDQGSILRGKV